MQGVIVGGWEYVGAAYGLVWGGIVVYGTMVVLWARHASRAAAQNASAEKKEQS